MGFLSLWNRSPFLTQQEQPPAPMQTGFAPLAQPAQMGGLGIVPQGGFNPRMPQGPTQLPDQRQQSPLAGLPSFNSANAIQPPSLMERVQGIAENPLFAYGMAALGAAEPGGGGWGQAGQDIMAIQQANAQRQRQERQDQRETQAWQRQQIDWTRQDQRHQSFEQAVQQASPEMRAQLMAMGPEGYAQYQAQARQMDFQRSMAADDRAFQAQEGARNRAAQTAAQRASMRPFLQRDAMMLAERNDRAAQLQTNGLPALMRLRENIVNAGRAATGQPIDYQSRIVLSRVFNGQGPERQALETWRSRIVPLALQNLPPGPATDRDVALAMESMANPNMTLGSALELVDDMVQRYRREIDEARYATEFFNQAGGITGVTMDDGTDYSTFLNSRLNPSGQQQGAGQQQTPASPQPQQAQRVGALPDASAVAVGTRASDGQYTLVVVQDAAGARRWVRENAAQRAAREAPEINRRLGETRNIGAGTR